jgi:hypothetical protein
MTQYFGQAGTSAALCTISATTQTETIGGYRDHLKDLRDSVMVPETIVCGCAASRRQFWRVRAHGVALL